MKICIAEHPGQPRLVDVRDVSDAMLMAGLQPGEVDFGELGGRLSIVVYQFGMFESADKRKYFSIGGSLYAGPAVIFQHDEAGETVDIDQPLPLITWYDDQDAIERALVMGRIRRPHIAIGGEITWQWPQPSPFGRGKE